MPVRKFSSFLIIAVFLACLPGVAVSASPGSSLPLGSLHQAAALTRVVTFSDLGYASDDTYKGVLASRDYAIRWPDAWQVQPGNILRLIFSHSPILHERSSLAVDWNGTRLASALLTQANMDHGMLEVPIPEELIKTGYNRLHIEFYMGLDDEDFCVDEDNPGLWATVHSASNLTLVYTENPPVVDLGLYPQPFVDNSQLVENAVTFILPKDPTPAELNAAAVISAGLGKLAAWHTVTLQAGEPVGQVRAGDLIIIGTPQRNPWISSANLAFLNTAGPTPVFKDSAGKALPESAGILWEAISPGEPTSVALYVTGSDDDAVVLAARALASTTTIARLSGQMGLILSVPDPLSTGPGDKVSITLEELGYPDMQARGTREQNITYVISLEKAWKNESEILFDLHFAHSRVLNQRRSSVTVEVNGTAAGSIALDASNAENAHASFHLPTRLFNVGSNTITISANLRLPDDVEDDWNCLDSHTLDSWLVVYADSLITLPSETSGAFITLADYPSGYIGGASLSDLAFVVPPSVSIDLATAVLLISEGLGDASPGDHYYPRVLPAVDIESAAAKYKYLYLVGRPSQNPAINHFSDRLPMPFLPGTDEPQAVDGVARLVSGSSSAGYIEAFLGDLGAPNLVVSGNSDTGILWAAGVLQNPSRYSRLAGDLAILDGPASIASFEVRYKASSRFAAAEEAPAPAQGISLGGASIRPARWVAYAAGAIFLLALIILLIFAIVDLQNKQKARSQHGSHSA